MRKGWASVSLCRVGFVFLSLLGVAASQYHDLTWRGCVKVWPTAAFGLLTLNDRYGFELTALMAVSPLVWLGWAIWCAIEDEHFFLTTALGIGSCMVFGSIMTLSNQRLRFDFGDSLFMFTMEFMVATLPVYLVRHGISQHREKKVLNGNLPS